MIELSQALPPEQRIFLAVDTSSRDRAEQLIDVARDAGASVVKLGLEISSATSWRDCSRMASEGGVDWVADAKIDDIPNTTAGIVDNLLSFDHPPVGITIHTNSGIKSMELAQELAEQAGTVMLGVTHLTSVEQEETKWTFGFGRRALVGRRLRSAYQAGIGGFVSAADELRVAAKKPEFREMFGMIPGTRSEGVASHDQKNVKTPYMAIVNGAGALVIGRQITEAPDPRAEFSRVRDEIAQGLAARSTR